jgi:hypothetical protein
MAMTTDRDLLMRIQAVVNEQAEDDGLWFINVSITEAYLQQELRKLHEVIEQAVNEATNCEDTDHD